MRYVPAALIGAGLLSVAAAWAQPAETGAAIGTVIRDQLSDFNARDLDGAFDHASGMIRRMFETPESFGRMVEQGYPMVWDSDSARLLDLTERDGAWIQRVLIRDAQGVPHLLDYRMIQTPEGWRIDGVSLLAGPQVGV